MHPRRPAQRLHSQHLHPRMFLLCVILCLLMVPAANGQDSEVPVSLPISLSDIPAQASAESVLLEQSERLLSRAAALDDIENELLAQERDIVQNLIRLKSALAAASSREAISEIEQTWQELSGSLEGSEKELRSRAIAIEQQLALASARHEVWRKTLAGLESPMHRPKSSYWPRRPQTNSGRS